MDRRAEILRAAGQIAVDEGIGAISVRNVAGRAGIGASTLRHYFPTQQDLFDAVLGETFNAHLEDLRINDSSVPPVVRLTECMAQFLPPSDAHIPQLEGWLAGYTAALGPGRSDQGRAVLSTLSRQARERVNQWLTVLGAEGALRMPSIEHAGTILLATVNGLSLELITPGTPARLETARDVLGQVIGAAVVAPGPQS